LSVLAMTWDLAVLPLSAFQVDEVEFVQVMGISTMSFWIADLCFSFFLAYYKADGHLETRPLLIVKHSILTWFPLDFSLVALDVAFRSWLSVNGGFARAGKSAKVLSLVRTMRMMRMARALKLPHFMDQLMGATLSTFIAAALAVLRLLAEVAFATHCIGCTWYALGMYDGIDGGWMRSYADTDKPYRYIIAFHWAIAQFTPAPNRLHPTNERETAFAVLVLFIGLVVFSNLLGRVTALVAKSSNEASQRAAETDLLRSLCRERSLSSDLGQRLMRFVALPRQAAVKRARLEADVRCLEKVPLALLVRLRTEMYGKADPNLLPRRGAPLLCETGTALPPGTWLSEGALWTQWIHRGTVEATRPGAILTVHSERFRHAIATGEPTSLHLMRLYAQQWLHRMSDATRCGPVDDTWCAFDLHEDVLSVVSHPLEEMTTRRPSGTPRCERRDGVGGGVVSARLVSAAFCRGSARYHGRRYPRRVMGRSCLAL